MYVIESRADKYVIESRADKMSLAVIWPTNIFKWHCNSSNSKKGGGRGRDNFVVLSCRLFVRFIRIPLCIFTMFMHMITTYAYA